jgi:hypothetical protein
MKKMALEW